MFEEKYWNQTQAENIQNTSKTSSHFNCGTWGLTKKELEQQKLLERGKIEQEKWRDVLKLGSLLGDKKDIKRRKDLSNIAMRNLEKLWYKRKQTPLKKKIKTIRDTCEEHTVI